MNLIVIFVCSLFSITVGVEHATDIQIDQVEVIEIPWREALPPQGGNPPPPVYGPPPPDCPPPSSEFEPPAQEPKPVYGPPLKPVYGPPPEVPTTTELSTTTELGTTTESSTVTESSTTELPTTTIAPGNKTINKSARLRARKDELNQGVYYIYHPEGLLQRVSYSTKDDEKNMEYTTKLKYHNVEPIKGPIYTYDPKSFAFQRVNKRSL